MAIRLPEVSDHDLTAPALSIKGAGTSSHSVRWTTFVEAYYSGTVPPYRMEKRLLNSVASISTYTRLLAVFKGAEQSQHGC